MRASNGQANDGLARNEQARKGTAGSRAGHATRKRVGLTRLAEARLRRALRRAAPSEPWVDAQITTYSDTDARGEAITYRFHNPHVFPPGGAETAMVRCPACGVFTPPCAIEHGLCLDHAEHEGWGPSPSAVAIRGLQYRNLRLTDAELRSESASALRREIRRFEETGKGVG